MDKDLKKLEEIKNELTTLQSKVEFEGDVDGIKTKKLEALMEEFDTILNNLNLDKNENK